MGGLTLKIEVCLSEREFVGFGLFDAFRHRRSWTRPALFAAILAGSAAVCFMLHDRRGAVLLGIVLLVVALGLPAAWFLSFFLSVRGQARSLGLGDGAYVYTLTLGEEGLSVDNGRERAAYPWAGMFRAYRRPDAVYLYVTPRRAFLIPNCCAEGGGERLWALIVAHIPEDLLIAP